eukprot:m.276040 g.276040  ORF g.276040 m.276040 type:complete len:1250 (+) comp15706_c0_seq1:98-3847(+)
MLCAPSAFNASLLLPPATSSDTMADHQLFKFQITEPISFGGIPVVADSATITMTKQKCGSFLQIDSKPPIYFSDALHTVMVGQRSIALLFVKRIKGNPSLKPTLAEPLSGLVWLKGLKSVDEGLLSAFEEIAPQVSIAPPLNNPFCFDPDLESSRIDPDTWGSLMTNAPQRGRLRGPSRRLITRSPPVPSIKIDGHNHEHQTGEEDFGFQFPQTPKKHPPMLHSVSTRAADCSAGQVATDPLPFRLGGAPRANSGSRSSEQPPKPQKSTNCTPQAVAEWDMILDDQSKPTDQQAASGKQETEWDKLFQMDVNQSDGPHSNSCTDGVSGMASGEETDRESECMTGQSSSATQGEIDKEKESPRTVGVEQSEDKGKSQVESQPVESDDGDDPQTMPKRPRRTPHAHMHVVSDDEDGYYIGGDDKQRQTLEIEENEEDTQHKHDQPQESRVQEEVPIDDADEVTLDQPLSIEQEPGPSTTMAVDPQRIHVSHSTHPTATIEALSSGGAPVAASTTLAGRDTVSGIEAARVVGSLTELREPRQRPRRNPRRGVKKNPGAVLCSYKPHNSPPLEITQADLARLEPGEFLNDIIINFYLHYLLDHLKPAQRQRFYIFNTYFYSTLKTKGFDGVKRWIKSGILRTRDFLIIPINENAHWHLAIVCFPFLLENQQSPLAAAAADPEPYKAKPPMKSTLLTNPTNLELMSPKVNGDEGGDTSCVASSTPLELPGQQSNASPESMDTSPDVVRDEVDDGDDDVESVVANTQQNGSIASQLKPSVPSLTRVESDIEIMSRSNPLPGLPSTHEPPPDDLDRHLSALPSTPTCQTQTPGLCLPTEPATPHELATHSAVHISDDEQEPKQDQEHGQSHFITQTDVQEQAEREARREEGDDVQFSKDIKPSQVHDGNGHSTTITASQESADLTSPKPECLPPSQDDEDLDLPVSTDTMTMPLSAKARGRHSAPKRFPGRKLNVGADQAHPRLAARPSSGYIALEVHSRPAPAPPAQPIANAFDFGATRAKTFAHKTSSAEKRANFFPRRLPKTIAKPALPDVAKVKPTVVCDDFSEIPRGPEPCILLYDSLKTPGDAASREIRKYLNSYAKEFGINQLKPFASRTLPSRKVKAVMQDNSCDCGVFLLQFMKSFMEQKPEPGLGSYQATRPDVSAWFSLDDVISLRFEVKRIIQVLGEQQNHNSSSTTNDLKMQTQHISGHGDELPDSSASAAASAADDNDNDDDELKIISVQPPVQPRRSSRRY